MSFALSTIIIVILLLPGAIVSTAYYSSLRIKKSSIHISTQELLLKGLTFSFIIHCCAICLLRYLGYQINFNILYTFILGKELNISDELITSSVLKFFSYNITLVIFSWFITKIFKHFVYKYKLDLNLYSLRLTNYWFHVFSARYLDGPGIKGKEIDTDFIFVDILVENKIIYSGILNDFNYSAYKDELENIILQNARKSILHEHEKDGVRHSKVGATSKIPGDVFLIPASQIININITYIKIVKEDVIQSILSNNTSDQPS